MKKFIVFTLLIAIMTLSFGCAAEKPTDLSGTWVLSADDGANEESTGELVIDGKDVVVYFVWPQENTKALLWYGTYTPPKKVVDEYSWTSTNDPDMTKNSIYAPDFEETTFQYKHGMILFDYYVNGVVYTFHFERKANEEAA